MNLTALFAASVEPFYFESIDLNDTAAQQAEWDYLMKYKIFGQNGIDFKGGKISIPDKVGWFGTADGDFTLANTNHNVGGPILIGGDMKFDDGIDTISTGPVRVLGSIYTSNFTGPNILNGIHCVGGTIADKYLQSLNGPKYPLEECPETVPVIKEDLSIPRVDYTGKVFNPKITLNNSTAYIDVPEGEGPYDYYLEGISFDNPGNLIVRMPSGGRLTRIFIQNNINFGPHPTIKVHYMATDAVNEAGVWTGAYQEIQNSDYAGNLLFYVDNDIAVPSISASDSIQGTFISTGTISIEQHMTLAGQLLAKKVTINFNFDGSGFLYVPFDPPVLNIDPTALGSGVFIESNEDQKVNITLDILPETDVVFDYCFEIDTSETAPIGVAHWSDFGPLNNGKIMPICGRDTATLTIKEGFLKPDLNNEVFVHPRLDDIVEGLETFQLMVFNLMGAVLPGNLKSGSFTLSIKDADASPNTSPVILDQIFSIKENSPAGTVVGTVIASDPDINAPFNELEFSVLSGTGKELFEISSTGVITVKEGAVLDFESKDSYSLEVKVQDGGGLSATATVTINIEDVNEAPNIADQDFSVEENSPAGTVVGTVIASDPDINAPFNELEFSVLSGTGKELFEISSTGVITVKEGAVLDLTIQKNYTLEVVVQDGGGLSDTATVTINIEDVNEAPNIANQDFSVEENSPAGSVVGTVVANDPDTKAPFNELEFSVLSGSGKELFEISSTGVITVKEGAVLDFESKDSYSLEVKVQDGGGLSDTATVTINIEDVNEAPNIADQGFSIEENSPAGTVVGIVIASDPDINAPFNELEFSVLSGSGKELFEISSTGVITVKEGAVLDYESKDSYSLEVKVQDGGGLSDTATITVRLVDVNESPSIANQTFSVKEDINSNVKIGSIIYKDPENDVLSFTLEEDPSGIFQVTEYGDIYLKEGASLDFETKDTYKIKVKGVDPGGLFDIAEITIRVLDVFEKSEVEIIKAISKDSIYLYPDIIYINTLDIELEWKENGVLKFGDTTLNEGKNIIVKELCEISKNECGRDTLIVYVNTKSPTVTLTPKKNTEEKISGVTIVEQQNNLDSAYYVNQNDNKILVNLQEEGINGEPVNKTFELTAKLDTIHLSKKNIETTQKISQAWSFEKSQDIKVLTVDGVQKATYTTTIDGVTLTVTYDLNGSDNKAVVEYETQIDGKKVIIFYVADTKTGKVMTDPKTGAFYTVSYPYLDANKNEILVSYGVTESGKLIKDPQDESVLYTLTYAYTNLYGNTGTKSIEIVLDKTPPVVQIIGPLEGSVVSGVSVNVIWTVDGVEQDTLNLQGLEGGVNYIIRAFRDKAGNERSDTVVVYSKGTKDIVVQMQESLIEIDKKTMALFSNPNQDNKTRYRVTVLNAKTGLEEEVVVGTDKGSKAGNRKEPYPNLTGSHLGPTLDIDLKLPSLNPLGGMASIGDLVESDGLIAIESGGGWDREKVSVEEYVSKYCSDEFQRDYRQNSSFDEALYNVSVSLHMWIFTSLGSFVESYNVKLDIDSKEYANAAGVAKLFFELVPNAEGYLVDNRGRSLGTGAYLFKTEIQMLFEQRCALPDQTPIGKKKKVFEDWLSSFGYKRLNLK